MAATSGKRAKSSGRASGSSGLRASASDRLVSAGARAGSRKKVGRGRIRRFAGASVYWGSVAGIWIIVGAVGLLSWHAMQLPPIDRLAVPKRPPNIAILASDGTLLANRGDTGGPAIRLSGLPRHLPEAFIAIEDRRFHQHWGLDLYGIGRAFWSNLASDGSLQGGSTITQQLAKNLFLTQQRTLSRKIQEAILAVWLERNYSKDQILQLYLNRVYFGSGAYGIEAAARRYFDKSATQLTLPEAAMLAGLVQAPVRFAPNRNPDGAEARANMVLAAMARQGRISEREASLALANPARAIRNRGGGSINYAADFVMDQLAATVGAIDEDIVVQTTIDPALQRAAESALVERLAADGAKFGVGQGAVLSMRPNGAITALVGGRDYASSQFNRAVSARRQPGSAFKPIVYLTALERGLTPGARRLDGPISVRGWRPANAGGVHHGEVTLTRALALSLNTVAVRLALELGPEAVASTARRLGVRSSLRPHPSLALGTSEVNLLEMTRSYAVFANGGIRVEPFIISRVRRADGREMMRRASGLSQRVVAPQHVAALNAMMQETLLTGTARRADLPGWQPAGKTGTTQGYRDAWFIGYTTHMVAGVWLGNDDSSPTRRVSGSNLPVDIWSRFMRQAHVTIQPDRLPTGIWRDPDAASPDSRAPAENRDHFVATPASRPGAPMTINPLGRAREPAREPPLVPPARIDRSPTGSIPREDRSLLQRMLGG